VDTSNIKAEKTIDSLEYGTKSYRKGTSNTNKCSHARTNSVSGTKVNSENYPNLKLNLNNINNAQNKEKEKKIHLMKDNHPHQVNNFIKGNNINNKGDKFKDKAHIQSNIINIYASNMNNIKAKEINLKQFINNKFNSNNRLNNINPSTPGLILSERPSSNQKK